MSRATTATDHLFSMQLHTRAMDVMPKLTPAQDGDNNTILHLLASLPTPPSSHSHHSLLPPLPPSRSLEETRSIAIRMLELYHTLFPFLLDWSNSGGKTPVHVAAQAGNADFIGVLVELGADVDLTDLQGNSPLHYASAWGHLDTVQILLEAGCSMSGKNAEGFTAVDYSFSDRAAVTLQTTARAVWEDRQNRQKEDMKRFEASDKRERTRSGSVSTSYSGTQSVTASSALSGSGQGSQGGYASPHAQLIAREHCFDQSQSQQDFAPPAPSNHRSLGPSRTSSQIGIGTALPNSSLPSLTNSSPKPPPPPPSKSPPIPTLRPISTQPFVLGPPVGQASADPGNSATMRRVNSAQVGAPDRDGTVTMRRAGSGLEATVTRR